MSPSRLYLSDLDSAETVRRSIDGREDIVVEVGVAVPDRAGLLAMGSIHQSLADIRAAGVAIEVALPHHSSVTKSSPILMDSRARLAIAQADRVVGRGRRDLTSQAQEVVALSAGTGQERVLIADNDAIEFEGDLHPIFSRYPERSRSGFVRELRALGILASAIDDQDTFVGPSALFLKEAIDNVRLHAIDRIGDSARIDGVSCVSLRTLDFATTAPSIPTQGDVAVWRRGVEAIMQRRAASTATILEVTIADAGEGVPATMREDHNIYEKPHVLEVQAIHDALTSKGTRLSDRPHVTPTTKKGFGFTQMLNALTTLRGVMVIRTGRTRLTWSALDFDDDTLVVREPSEWLYRWQPERLPLIVGTSVSFAFLINPQAPSQADTLFDQV